MHPTKSELIRLVKIRFQILNDLYLFLEWSQIEAQ
jgi:hypothetical protein